MDFGIKKRAIAGAVGAAAMLIAGTVQAALQDRDLNGDKIADAFYDTDRGITWLRDANVKGQIEWSAADTWAKTLVVGGVDEWRLPSTSGICFGYNCINDEMGHLWYSELGNSAGAMTNTGNFQGLQSNFYWMGSPGQADQNYGWGFDTVTGAKSLVYLGFPLYAMAVHSGDLGAPIPEPHTYALMLAGLAGLTLARRQLRR